MGIVAAAAAALVAVGVAVALLAVTGVAEHPLTTVIALLARSGVRVGVVVASAQVVSAMDVAVSPFPGVSVCRTA